MAFLENLLIMLPGFILAISFHEMAHAYMAYKLGDPMARNLGRITMNPAKHFDLYGSLAFLVVGLGWGRPVPVNSRMLRKPKRDMALISLAGPVANLILAFLTFLLFVIITYVLAICGLGGWLYEGGILKVLVEILFYVYVVNISLMVFNLIPIPPLDGSKILFSLLPHKAYRFVLTYERYGMFIMLAVLYLGILDVPLSMASGFFYDILYNTLNAVIRMVH